MAARSSAAPEIAADDEAVDDDVEAAVSHRVGGGDLVEVARGVVHVDAAVALFEEALAHAEVALGVPRGDAPGDHHALPVGGPFEDGVGGAVDGAAAHLAAAAVAGDGARARPEQPQVVGELGHRADGGARG